MDRQRIEELLAKVASVVSDEQATLSTEQDKINLFVFAQHNQNVLKIILEAFSIVPKDSIDGFFMRGCECDIIEGNEDKIYQVDGDNKTEVDINYVTAALAEYDISDIGLKFEFVTDKPLAKSFNVHIFVSADEYRDVNWSYIQSNADYVLFTLTATALLSMCERKVLKTNLLPCMSGELGVLLTNDNMILSDDKQAINSSLENMFGEYSTPVFRFTGTDEESFEDFLKTMPDKREELVGKKLERANKVKLNELLSEVNLEIEVLSSDNAKLDDAIALLNSKLEKLPERKESAFRRARMNYTSKLRIDLNRAISDFHQAFKQKLSEEISSDDDVRGNAEIIPGYIEKQWNDEAKRMLDYARQEVRAINNYLMKYVNDDIVSYIEEDVSEDFANYVFGITKIFLEENPVDADTDIQGGYFDFELSRDNSKLVKYGTMAVGTVVALTFGTVPFLIGGTIALLSSRVLSKETEKAFIAKNKEALIEASHKMCLDYNGEMSIWVDQVVNDIEDYVEKSIGQCYQRVIDLMIEAIRSKQQDFSSHEGELDELKQLKAQIEDKLN